MYHFFLAAVLFFSISAQAQNTTRIEQIMKEMKEHANHFNKKRDFDNFVKYFVHNRDKDTLAYLKRKYSNGELHGTLPEVKIFIKKNEISIHEDKLKVIDFHKNKFSLNGYDFQINRNMTTEDFFSYIDRILRSQKIQVGIGYQKHMPVECGAR